jgi:hypothetical protein
LQPSKLLERTAGENEVRPLWLTSDLHLMKSLFLVAFLHFISLCLKLNLSWQAEASGKLRGAQSFLTTERV